MAERSRSPVRRVALAARARLRRPAAGSVPATGDEPSSARDGAQDFDVSVLDRLVQLDGRGDALAELIGLFARDADARRAALTDAAQRGDARALVEAAHSIKGAALSFGARRLAQLAAEVEDGAKAGHIADPPLIESTAAALDGAVRFLQARRDGPAPTAPP